jgi:hypothetical protein
MPENKSRRVLQSPTASHTDCDFAPRSLRTPGTRVTMRRRSASLRVGTQRRRYQRIAADDPRPLALDGRSEPSPVNG